MIFVFCLLREKQRNKQKNSNYCIEYNNRNCDERKPRHFFAGSDALVYLTKTMHKKYSAILPTYLMTHFLSSIPLCASVHILDAPSIAPVVYILNGWPWMAYFSTKKQKQIRTLNIVFSEI